MHRLALAISAVLMLCGCKEALYSDLNEHDANEMMFILLGNDIDTDKSVGKKGVFTIEVDRAQRAAAVRVLREYGYPRERHKSWDEIFPDGGLLPSPSEERARLWYGLSQNVQETLSRMDGVLVARVNVALPEKDPFADNEKPSSASVFIKHHPDSDVPNLVSDIKLIVEQSIEGLTYDNIALSMQAAKIRPRTQYELPWKQVMGIKLAPEAVDSFMAMLVAFGVCLLGALVGCGYLLIRVRALSREDDSEDESDAIAASYQKPFERVLKVVSG